MAQSLSALSKRIKPMSGNAALNVTRVGARVALASLLGVWLAGCSSDSTRLADPFTNPFSTASNDQAPPVRHVASNASAQPNANYAAVAHPSPVAVSALSAPAPATTGAIAKSAETQPVAGFGNGWHAAGGSPIVVADGENLETISRRYGVPTSALMQANGFTSASQVHGGVRLIVPVYDAAGKTASAEASDAAPAHKAHDKAVKAEEKSKGKNRDDDAQDDSSPRKSHEKSAKAEEKGKDKVAQDKHAHDKSSHDKQQPEADASKPAPSAKPAVAAKSSKPADVVAKADVAAAPATTVKKKSLAADPAPTASLHAEEPASAPVLTGNQADAAGVSPEFRWPARGRIIQGFKSGGNDGINIAVPEGTSVKAAESGVVAYAGSELKGYGNLILIRHPNGFVSAYANNGELDVKRGDSVKRGQIIAKSGQSGNVSSPQLHFELRKGSTPVDPTSFLAGL
jgi:murein DD-endopeptidase MepM/ murein hydrolase activator NlpD